MSPGRKASGNGFEWSHLHSTGFRFLRKVTSSAMRKPPRNPLIAVKNERSPCKRRRSWQNFVRSGIRPPCVLRVPYWKGLLPGGCKEERVRFNTFFFSSHAVDRKEKFRERYRHVSRISLTCRCVS